MPIPVLIPQNPLTPTDGLLKKNLLAYRSTNINNPADSEDNTYTIEDITEADAMQQGIEPLPDRTGSQVQEPFNMYKMFRMRGWVRAPTLSGLYDKIEVINAAFHPEETYVNDSATFNKGYRALDFNVPTLDTTNYTSGLIASRYYVQALQLPVSVNSKFDGLNARIDFALRAVDPRRYWQTSSTVNRTGNGTVSAVNTLATYSSWPIITIVFTTAPSGDLTINRTSPGSSGSIVIDGTLLSGSTTYLLDLQARTFETSGGTNKINAVKGTSRFFNIRANKTNTIDFSGFPSNADITVTWVRAFI